MTFRVTSVERGPMGNAIYRVQHHDGTPVSWSLYWNGTGSRVKLAFNSTDPGGVLVSIDAEGCDMPAMTMAEATAIVYRFLAI